MGIIYTNTTSNIKRKLKSKADRDAYALWCKKYGIDPEGKVKRKAVDKSPLVLATVYRRETVKPPSLGTHTGTTSAPEKKVYTGENIVGIAAMHKSNLVPIFNNDAAKDVASMRR